MSKIDSRGCVWGLTLVRKGSHRVGRVASEAKLCEPTPTAQSFWSRLPEETGQCHVKMD